MELTELCFAGVARQAARGAVGRGDRAGPGRRAPGAASSGSTRSSTRSGWSSPRRPSREADAADERRAAGEDAPLLGVPIAVKEDIAIEGLPTTKGTNAARTPEPADSAIVQRLRAGRAR